MRGLRNRERVAAILALILLTVAAYWPATQAGFIWDDDDYVTGNETLRSASGLKQIWLEPGAVPQYYPLVHSTFWAEYHLWGLRPFGYHLVNILLHALGTVLVFLLVSRLGLPGGLPGAWFAAVLFAVHPVQVESVAWITERKNVLSAVFYFAAFLAYVRFLGLPRNEAVQREETPREGFPAEGRRRLWYAAALFLFLCALWSKTVAASFPVAVLLLLWYRRGRVTRREALALAPFFLLGAAMGMVTLWMERVHVRAQGAEWDLSFMERVLIAGRAFWFYLTKLVLPVRLSFIYPRWTVDPTALLQLLPPLGALALFVVLWRRRDGMGRGPLAALAFFAVTVFPALGFFNTFPMRYSFVADHFQYMAALGPFLLAGAGMAAASRAGRPALVRAVSPVVLLVLALLSFGRARDYRDPETLWVDTLAKNPSAWMARHNLGKLYEEEGRVPEALEQYSLALQIRPDLDTPLFNMGNLYSTQGRAQEAIASYERALQINPNMVEARNNLGNVLYKTGRAVEAMEQYSAAATLDPTYTAAHRNLAFALADQGRIEEAVERYRTVLLLEPEDHASMNRLAWLLATTSAGDGARRAPGDGADGSSGGGPGAEPSEALLLAERACRATSYQNPIYLATLAAACAADGRFEQAVMSIDEAIRLARAAGREPLAARWETQREMYKSGHALRQGP